jgi:thiamine-monophosphate kinase
MVAKVYSAVMQAEFDIIGHYFRPLAAGFDGAFDLRDDAAYMSLPDGCELVISTDMLLAGVHFFPDDPPALIAKKALRVNLSDLAAKGAEPIGYSLALALPAGVTADFMAQFCQGLKEDQAEFALALIGGDTTTSPHGLCVTITIYGSIPFGRRVMRSGAKIGDDIYISGQLGLAALGLHCRKLDLDYPEFIARYHLPQPRMKLMDALAAENLVHASMDISDGLWGDLAHILTASGVGAAVHLPSIPQSATVQEFIKKYALSWVEVLGGGDDYELLFTSPPAAAAQVFNMADRLGVSIARIGTITADTGISVFDATQNPIAIANTGYQHRF